MRVKWKIRSASLLLTICTCISQFRGVQLADVEYKGKEIIEYGRPFSIECRLSAFNFPKWTRDGIPLDPDDGYELAERKEPDGQLVLTLSVAKADRPHAGVYRCSSFSRESHKIALLHLDDEDEDLNGDSDDDSSVILREKHTLRIYCKLPKEDNFPISWFKNNYRILPGLNPRITTKGRNLTIHNAEKSDAGEYMCTSTDLSTLSKPAVSSPHETIGHITTVKFPADVEPFPARMELRAGSDLYLECKVHGSPIPRITWYIGNILASTLDENDERIELIANEKGLPSAILRVANLTQEDKSLYTCRARNSVEEDEASVFITIRDSIIKTNEPEPGLGIILEPGKQLMLQCNITEADIDLEVHWEKDGKSLVNNEDGFVIDKVNNTLSVNKAIEKNHTGTYVCIATTHQNDKRANATIIVTTRPGVEPFHKSLNLVQGDKLVLTCTYSGVPRPNITWWKDEVLIADNDTSLKVLTPEGLQTSTLSKEELDYDDRAEYTCQAAINGDVANTTILIRVKDRLAALWPFLGICAEVAILCTIIFVYEKKRSKPEFEDADNDNNTENKNLPDQKEGSHDVRQRK